MALVAVTGGAGFIGSHLTERLLADGERVRVIDNFATGRERNLAAVRDHGWLTIHRDDICDAAAMEAALAGVETVYHLAGLADIVPSIERPGDYFRTNVDGTFTVMQAARSAGVRRVVYAASSSCYGIPDVHPTPETAEPRPQYPYALTKHLGEQIVLHWGKVYGITASSLRLFNVYGPRSRTSGTYGAVFGVFLAQKIAGRPFTVVGDGTQSRDFTFVTDVADAFVSTARRELPGAVLNVGSGATRSINALVALLGGEVVHVPKRPGEPDVTFADVSRIGRLVGWQARVPFEDGVHAMLERIDDWRDAPVWDPTSIERATSSWFAHLGRAASAPAPAAVAADRSAAGAGHERSPHR